MKTDQYGQMIFDQDDLCNFVMQGQDVTRLELMVDKTVDFELAATVLEDPGNLLLWSFPVDSNQSLIEFDTEQQRNWHMPDEYKQLDIAEHVLSLCRSDAELQRVAQELLLYQERDLFHLLRYLKYLVDLMRENNLIWGVGRGSSVSSHVLYLLGVHRIDSIHYNLDIAEFLR
jgi:DNA polymerase III alpha subunit